MFSKKINKIKQDYRQVNWIFGGAAATTIYFNTKIQDPFNAPKFWILLFMTSWLLGFITVDLVKENKVFLNSFKIPLIVLSLFVISLFISYGFSDNKQIALLGENMRRNGLLTYLCFSILLIAGFLYVKDSLIKRIYAWIVLTSLTVSGYGIMQWTGNDFVQWSDHGKNTISTLGNSNFAGSLMSILAILVFGGLFIRQFGPIFKLVLSVVFLMLLVAILPTNARQALVILGLGLGVIVIVVVSVNNKKIALLLSGLGTFVFILAVLGMLQVGPLKDLLYKNSVTVRGFYWRAGVKMFTENIWFGVGLDNYGSYFKELRESQYSLNYGFGLTSTNAHNSIIQQFATGGLFVGISYLLIIILIGLNALKTLRNSIGDKKIIVGTFFAAWLAYQAQSIISIDNIGISIWGWVISGALLGLSHQTRLASINESRPMKRKSSSFDFRQQILSSIFVAISVFFVAIFYQGELAMNQQRAAYNPNNPNQNAIFKSLADKTIRSFAIDDQYKIITASYLGGMGFGNEAIKLLEELNAKDPRNLDTLTLLSSFNEQLGNLDRAIYFREQISKLDPWNAENYLMLGRNYKKLNEAIKVQFYKDKILSFASKDPIAEVAELELKID
jgi:O-antigen ligase